MDPIAFLITWLPEPYAMALTILVTVASVADWFLPDAQPPSRWAIPRAVVHLLALNRQAAQDKLSRWRELRAP